jgi:hypothetical protein
VIDFLRAANELATRHLGRLADDSR